MNARIAPEADFNTLMRDITDDRSNDPVQVGSPLWNPLRKNPYAELDFHDFRDRNNPLEKVHPDPHHHSRWPERTDFDVLEP